MTSGSGRDAGEIRAETCRFNAIATTLPKTILFGASIWFGLSHVPQNVAVISSPGFGGTA